jgi:hypothetical protein
MQRKSKHKEISDLDKSSEYPVVKRGYLDTKKQSNNTEILEEVNNPTEPFKCPVVERGYLDTIDQSENTETQEEKKDSLYHKIIWSCVFVIFILAIAGHAQFSPGAFGLFIILIIFLAILFCRIKNK